MANINPKKKLLLLDLDETLISTEILKDKKQVRVLVRPYAREFIKQCSQYWNVAIFTASTRAYAEGILKKLDPEGCYISNLLCREQCIQYGAYFVKDLRIIQHQNIDIKQFLIIDNRLSSFGFHLNNGIPILPFRGESSDQELKDILVALNELQKPETSITDWISARYSHERLQYLSQNLL